MEDLFWQLFAPHASEQQKAAEGAVEEDSISTTTTTRATNTNDEAHGSHATDGRDEAMQLKDLLNPEYTYIFELCGKLNKVVTVYGNLFFRSF
jgi:hypothetical protein